MLNFGGATGTLVTLLQNSGWTYTADFVIWLQENLGWQAITALMRWIQLPFGKQTQDARVFFWWHAVKRCFGTPLILRASCFMPLFMPNHPDAFRLPWGFLLLPLWRSETCPLKMFSWVSPIFTNSKCGKKNHREMGKRQREENSRPKRIWMFPKMVGFPTTIGFPTKNDHFGVFWGVPLFLETPICCKVCLKLSSSAQDDKNGSQPFASSIYPVICRCWTKFSPYSPCYKHKNWKRTDDKSGRKWKKLPLCFFQRMMSYMIDHFHPSLLD